MWKKKVNANIRKIMFAFLIVKLTKKQNKKTKSIYKCKDMLYNIKRDKGKQAVSHLI